MAKLYKPLMSATAHGTIAGNLTFSERKSGSQVRWQKKQNDVETSARTAQRAKFSDALASWKILEVGVCECGFVLAGGDRVAISSLLREKRAPQFARYVSDFLNFYY